MQFLSDFDSELITGGFSFPSFSPLTLGIFVAPVTTVTPVTQITTVTTTGVIAGIVDRVNFAVNNSVLSLSSVKG
jgi:hypothetical protein